MSTGHCCNKGVGVSLSLSSLSIVWHNRLSSPHHFANLSVFFPRNTLLGFHTSIFSTSVKRRSRSRSDRTEGSKSRSGDERHWESESRLHCCKEAPRSNQAVWVGWMLLGLVCDPRRAFFLVGLPPTTLRAHRAAASAASSAILIHACPDPTAVRRRPRDKAPAPSRVGSRSFQTRAD